jgi:hypothetical protein
MQCNAIIGERCLRPREVSTRTVHGITAGREHEGMSQVSRVAQSSGRGGREWREKGQEGPCVGADWQRGGRREGGIGMVLCPHAAEAKQSRADWSRAAHRRRSSGTTSIKHDGLPVLAAHDWPGRAFPARMARGGSGDTGMASICILSQNTPANHASGAFREVCRIPSRPKPLRANLAPRR